MLNIPCQSQNIFFSSPRQYFNIFLPQQTWLLKAGEPPNLICTDLVLSLWNMNSFRREAELRADPAGVLLFGRA